MSEPNKNETNASERSLPKLAAFGALDTCADIMRAYELYRYNLFKEKYEHNEQKQ